MSCCLCRSITAMFFLHMSLQAQLSPTTGKLSYNKYDNTELVSATRIPDKARDHHTLEEVPELFAFKSHPEPYSSYFASADKKVMCQVFFQFIMYSSMLYSFQSIRFRSSCPWTDLSWQYHALLFLSLYNSSITKLNSIQTSKLIGWQTNLCLYAYLLRLTEVE